MKGAVTILQAVLIFAIALSLAVVAVPWTYASIQKSMDMSEMSTIREEMAICNDKLVETARTGTSNKCAFSASRGDITAKTEGIYYNLITAANICDTHAWAVIDSDNHLESMCDTSPGTSDFSLRWRWPSNIAMQGEGFSGEIIRSGAIKESIGFDSQLNFLTLTVIVTFDYVEGQSGREIEISRLALTEEAAKLKVNIR